jgi:hypothetical protein
MAMTSTTPPEKDDNDQHRLQPESLNAKRTENAINH